MEHRKIGHGMVCIRDNFASILQYVFSDEALFIGWLTGPLGDIFSGIGEFFQGKNGLNQLSSGVWRFSLYIVIDLRSAIVGNSVGKYYGLNWAWHQYSQNNTLENIRAFSLPIIIPNYGNYGGANWGITQQITSAEKNVAIPKFSPLGKVETRNEIGSFWHDWNMEDKNINRLQNSTAHLNWIRDVWTSEGVEPGPLGQIYRLVGTPAFFLFALLDK